MDKPKALYPFATLKNQSSVVSLGCSLLLGILLALGMQRTATAQDQTFLYRLHDDGKIWRYTGTPCGGNSCPGWQLLDINSRTSAITAGIGLYQLHNTGAIWRYTDTPCQGSSCPGWQLLDNNSRTRLIALDTVIR